jgi:hypothetical protein
MVTLPCLAFPSVFYFIFIFIFSEVEEDPTLEAADNLEPWRHSQRLYDRQVKPLG